MTRRPLAALAIAAGLWAATCQGAVRWCKDYDETLKLAKETGRPFLLVFARKGDASLRSVRKIFSSSRLARYSRVFLFCCVELEIVNNQIHSALLGKYHRERQIRLPLFYFADASETVLAKTGDRRAENLEYFFKLALHKHGPVADPRKLHEAVARLRKADELFKDGKYGAAASLYRSILALRVKAPPVAAARGKLAKIDEMAEAQLEAAQADLKDKAYADAVPKLAELERNFGPTKAGQAARKELARLRTLAEAKDAFAALEARAAAKGPGEPDATPEVDVEAECKIDGFSDEELDALDAMAQGGEPRQSPQQAADAARKARRLLGLARNWITNKRPDKAKDLLRKVIEDYPDTLYAEQAKAVLSGLE